MLRSVLEEVWTHSAGGLLFKKEGPNRADVFVCVRVLAASQRTVVPQGEFWDRFLECVGHVFQVPGLSTIINLNDLCTFGG